MLPLRDKNPSGVVPWAVYGLIAANSLVFVHELSLPPQGLMALVARYGMVPRQVTLAVGGRADPVTAILVPAIASMFLHGGWAHLIGNMWFLHIFGDNVEDRLGHLGFLVFYVFCGLMATAAQYVLYPKSPVPTIGASGAIAGVLGAYVVRWPRAPILTLVPSFYLIQFIELPTVIVLGIWFLLQFFQGAASLGVAFAHGVAYWAHVGGFVTGALLMLALPQRRRRSSS